MVNVEQLYSDLMQLINQRYYNKTEVDNKIGDILLIINGTGEEE